MSDKKFLDSNGLKKVKEDYEKKIGVKVDKVEGSQLVETTDVTKLKELANIKKVQVNSTDVQVGEDGTLNIDVQGIIDGDNLVSDSELTEKLADYAKRDDVPKVQIPTCTQEELEGKKATAVDGDRVVVTDEEYHIYIYIGETGTGEWKDTGTHINLSGYVQKEEGKSLVLDTDVTQITTNKTNIESLQSTIQEKANTSDLPEALSDEEIEAVLNPV